jgi:CheY-like chemotaxis protein
MVEGQVLLLVEDDATDALLVERALNKHGTKTEVRRVARGEELVHYLDGVGVYKDRKRYPFPNVLLLDLKMPGMDGFDVLAWRQASTRYRCLPVVVYSSSNLVQDIRRAYTLGANSYVVKSVAPAELSEMVEALQRWWCKFNATPAHA